MVHFLPSYCFFAFVQNSPVILHVNMAATSAAGLQSVVLSTLAACTGLSSVVAVCVSFVQVPLCAIRHFPPFTHLAVSCFFRMFLLQKISLLFTNVFLLNPFGNSTGYFLAVNVRTLSRAFFPPGLDLIAFCNLCVSPVYFYCASSN